jgi:hypothetical protein
VKLIVDTAVLMVILLACGVTLMFWDKIALRREERRKRRARGN